MIVKELIKLEFHELYVKISGVFFLIASGF